MTRQDLRQGGLPATSAATVLHRPAQIRCSGRSKEAETFKVCHEIYDLASDLLMWQTECTVRDYRDCKRGDLLQGVSTEASDSSVEATRGPYDLYAGSSFVTLFKCCPGVARSQ